MSADQSRESPTERPPMERAEDLLSRLGQRFTQSRERFSQTLEQRAAQTNGNGAATDARPATERAEDMLDRAGERVGAFASTAGYQMRRWLARAREEAEDIWAEARNVSQRNDAEARSTVAGATARTEKAGKAAPKRTAAARATTPKRATPPRKAASGQPRRQRKPEKIAE